MRMRMCMLYVWSQRSLAVPSKAYIMHDAVL